MTHLEPLDGRTYCFIGTADAHFGNAGLTRVSVPYQGQAKDDALTPSVMLVDANGRSVIGSMTKTGFTLRRLDAFGLVDDAFAASAAGLPQAYGAQTNQSRLDVELDATNRIYLLNGLTVTRYRSNGQVDRSFGDKGRARLGQFEQAADLDVGADGHVWVVGSAPVTADLGNRMQVLRLTADGRADTAFASGGVFTVPVPHVNVGDYGASAKGQVVHGNADGSVVFAGRGEYINRQPGESVSFYYHAIQSVRLDNLGRLVRTYGHRGIVTAPYIYNDAITTSNPQAVGIRSDGTVFVGNTFGTDSPDPATAGGADTRIIAPTGSTGILSKPGISTTVAGRFFDAPDGGSYFVNALGLWKLNADGTAYTTFNFGKPQGAITAAAIGNNGELLAAETGRDRYDRYYNVARYFVREGPSATFVPTVLTTSAKSLSFTVWYDDADGVNITTLNGQELRVRGPNFYARPSLTSTKRADDGSNRVIATYALRLAGGKKFTAANNGLYAVSLSTQGRPTDNEGNRADPRQIGTIAVNIA